MRDLAKILLSFGIKPCEEKTELLNKYCEKLKIETSLKISFPTIQTLYKIIFINVIEPEDKEKFKEAISEKGDFYEFVFNEF